MHDESRPLTDPTPDERRQGERYLVTDDDRCRARDGYVHLTGVMSDDEMLEIEAVYDRFLRGEIAVAGGFQRHDDRRARHGSTGYAVINVMVPRRYLTSWQGNLFERRAHSIAQQLCGEGMTIDFDQLLAKSPRPRGRRVRLAPGPGVLDRHRRPAHRHVLARHRRLDDRERVHAVPAGLAPRAGPTPSPAARRSWGEPHARHRPPRRRRDGARRDPPWRHHRAQRVGAARLGWQHLGRQLPARYIVALRSESTVAEERRRGFTHSHNDAGDVLDAVDGLHA
ncbi:MAG: hypothetical protein R2713_11150 [Ilumatobacteraceae bacterium]